MKPTLLTTLGLTALLVGCGKSVNSPASEAADLADYVYEEIIKDEAVETHTRDVSSKMKFEPITYKYKVEKPKEGTECGWTTCKKLEDESRCYIKYTNTSDDGKADWGIYKDLTFPCEGNEKEDGLKEALKRAKKKAEGIIAHSQAIKQSKEETLAPLVPRMLKSIISHNIKLGDGYSVKKCAEDYISAAGQAFLDYHAWGCDTEWTGETLVARKGFKAQIAKLAAKIQLLDCEKDDDSCKNNKAKLENDKKIVEGHMAYVQSLSGDEAKLYAHVNFDTAGSCLNKWLYSNDDYRRFSFFQEAGQACFMGGGDSGSIGSGALKAKRSELPANMKAIKTAQIAYESMMDTYVTCDAYPSYPSPTPQKWNVGSSGGFATIGWSPDGDVRGSYSVSTTATNFTITAISDIDGDGTYATYVATKSENPTLVTGANVY